MCCISESSIHSQSIYHTVCLYCAFLFGLLNENLSTSRSQKLEPFTTWCWKNLIKNLYNQWYLPYFFHVHVWCDRGTVVFVIMTSHINFMRFYCVHLSIIWILLIGSLSACWCPLLSWIFHFIFVLWLFGQVCYVQATYDRIKPNRATADV